MCCLVGQRWWKGLVANRGGVTRVAALAAGYTVAGKVSRKLAPLAELSTVASPPFASLAASRTIASPSPAPGFERDHQKPVEAVEDPAGVLVGHAGAMIGDDDLTLADRDLDRRAGRGCT